MIPAGAGLISSCSWFLYCGDPHPADGSLKSLQRRPPTRGADADFQERLNDIGNRYVTGGHSLSVSDGSKARGSHTPAGDASCLVTQAQPVASAPRCITEVNLVEVSGGITGILNIHCNGFEGIKGAAVGA
jgi:hypothetical protein